MNNAERIPPPRGVADQQGAPPASLPWFKVDSEWPMNDKLVEAGWKAVVPWFLILGLNARRGWCGIIPTTWSKSERIAALLAPLSMPPADVLEGVDALFRVGLLAEFKGGEEWQIPGWNAQEWGRPALICSRCNRRNPEPKFRACPVCRKLDTNRKGRTKGKPA